MSILSSLLGLGYFPRELPTTFTTADFGRHAADVLADWESANLFSTKNDKKFFGNYNYKVWDAEQEILSKPKRGYERRHVHITHPIPQALLTQELSKNWRAIAKIISKQRYSLDRISVSQSYARAIKGIDFRTHQTKKDYIESTSDWLVKTDIARFYPTIYTHSIPWAAYGKKIVKADLKKYEGSLAGRLDTLVRCCNRNQTIGIPIGPETSRIIAEIISSRIDDSVGVSIPNLATNQVDRLQDDWFVGADSLERAEHILSKLIIAYREYGLEINGTKTSVQHILKRDKGVGRGELASYLHGSRTQLRGVKLHDFLKLTLRLQADNPGDRVVSYGISAIELNQFSDNDIALIESFLLEAAVLAPISMDRICQLLINLHHDRAAISTMRVRDRFRVLCERSLENGNSYEALWLLHSLRGLRISFSCKRIAELSSEYSGSTIPLILLDMRHEGIFKSRLPTSFWEKQIDKDQVRRDWSWLLAYEGVRKGWLQDAKNVMSQPFFHAMNSRNIQFYDPTKNVPSVRATSRRRIAFVRASYKASHALITELRGMGAMFPFENDSDY